MRVDLDSLNVSWDHVLVVAGVELPLLPPKQVDDRATVSVHPGGLLRVPARVFALLRRALLGEHPLVSMRRRIAACVHPDYRFRLSGMDGADLLRIYRYYVDAQDVWVQQHVDRALGPLREASEAAKQKHSESSTIRLADGRPATPIGPDHPPPQHIQAIADAGRSKSKRGAV